MPLHIFSAGARREGLLGARSRFGDIKCDARPFLLHLGLKREMIHTKNNRFVAIYWVPSQCFQVQADPAMLLYMPLYFDDGVEETYAHITRNCEPKSNGPCFPTFGLKPSRSARVHVCWYMEHIVKDRPVATQDRFFAMRVELAHAFLKLTIQGVFPDASESALQSSSHQK